MPRGDARARKALVVRRGGEPIAFASIACSASRRSVVRPLDDPLVQVQGVSGATDLGDGRPTLVLDLVALGAAVGEPQRDARSMTTDSPRPNDEEPSTTSSRSTSS